MSDRRCVHPEQVPTLPAAQQSPGGGTVAFKQRVQTGPLEQPLHEEGGREGDRESIRQVVKLHDGPQLEDTHCCCAMAASHVINSWITIYSTFFSLVVIHVISIFTLLQLSVEVIYYVKPQTSFMFNP